MSDTRNLGQIQAVHVGDTPPDVTTMIWHNPGLGLWLAFNYHSARWEAFAGEHREVGLGAGPRTITHGLGRQYPGTVLAFNNATPVAVSVVSYVDEDTILVQLSAPATVVIRP